MGPPTQASASDPQDECKLEDLFENASSTTDLDSEIWLRDLRAKIYRMFRAPLKEEYHDEAFKWVSSLCMCKNRFSWLCSDENKWTKEEAKIFSLIARLSINEIQIVLPNIRRHLVSGDETDIGDDGKVLARPANPGEYSKFGLHLVIFEETIRSLVHGQDDDEDEKSHLASRSENLADVLESRELRSLLERLKELVCELVDYLEDVHRHWDEIMTQVDNPKFHSAQGALRAVCVWLSEDPGSFEPECKRFLIELFVRHLSALDQEWAHEANIDLLIMAVHAVCSGDEKMKQFLRDLPGSKEALQKYLDYVQKEQDNRKRDKVFKLKCGMVKDLL